MRKKIVVTGATGLIGRHILKILFERKDEVIIFSRSPVLAKREIPGATHYIPWQSGPEGLWQNYLNDADAVIHLAGEPVMGKRWSAKYKYLIMNSRKESTNLLVKAIAQVSQKPKVLVSASAIGYYGSDAGGEYTEESPAGNDFLADVCQIWENEATMVEPLGIRHAGIRTGIVLSQKGGALEKMKLPYSFFMGGTPGSGSQGFPWIHIDDIVKIFLRAADDESFTGAYNAVAPVKTTMKDFSHALGRVLGRPAWLNIPEFVVRLLAGEGATAILNTPFIIPKRLCESDFSFNFSNPETALRNILGR
ncbi:MAG: TIGR01777 family oxidoreductase [Ignavibacteria bacterium]